MEEDTCCSTCRTYSVRGISYESGRADEVKGRAGLSEQFLHLADFLTLINLVKLFGNSMYHQI